ncbi:MAG TPA: PQQ-binding-like beta-propeller repeat protein [Candidatus Polarisedimenticolaceae bacterium]|nr:PQQ-binding-like beta-propeller repeat protein [Candidatus Polarisedimenticolaceae bacterium]
MNRTTVLVLVALAGLGLSADAPPPTSWTQWGGPGQEFHAPGVPGTTLAAAWPESGPRKLWTRALGEGYSAILAEGDRLYTMYREADQEVVVCLSATDGKTVWERRYAASPSAGHVTQFGSGPRATPLLAGGRLYTVGVSGKMHCLDKADGKVVWSHDLWTEFGGTVLEHGYASSPIEYGDTVIALVGGKDQSIVAFRKTDGQVKWKAHSFTNSYSTPRLLDVDGEMQLVTFMAKELVGLDPATGALRWSFPQENEFKQNIAMPVMADRNYLMLSSPQAGAHGLKLTREGGKTKVEEVWATRKIQFYHVSTVRTGDWVFGSTGTLGPAFLAAVNIKTGEIGWRERGIAKANCIEAAGKLIILDEEGKLYLTTATPEKLVIHAQTKLLENTSWTVPTIVGKTLYVRDQKQLLAVDLG